MQQEHSDEISVKIVVLIRPVELSFLINQKYSDFLSE